MTGALRILVVDDDLILRRLMVTVVQQSGCQAIEADDGQEGLEKARELRPDIIVTDWLMPNLDGIDLVRAIRAEASDYRPYIILVTVLEDDGKLVESFDAGVDDFIGKPLRAKVIAARLRAAERIVRLQRENRYHIHELELYSEQLTATNLRLRELAITDELTGLPNRRYAMERLHQEWIGTGRRQACLSCLVIHLGGLKEINDLEGHERGDVVLKTVALILRKQADSQDIVCRIGGDEFLVICPDTSLEAALSLGERLVSAVRPFGARGPECPFGLSIGVAERRPEIGSCQGLINAADRSMYQAKRYGRNQVFGEQDRELRLIGGLARVC
ncbi:MAG TPA: diguanylate cyclase [Rhodocyclaceae bacterium]|nr:diguanylate cyclase [Rhodocyclaceae bacterium]